jgi:hypothetical protein
MQERLKMEEKIKAVLGEQALIIIRLQVQLEAATKELGELKAAMAAQKPLANGHGAGLQEEMALQ